ncbi:type VI secretion system tip protein VgrG [Dyadobacter flavalbus]|nr:type VI secretion system tip protein VgrG [Dyadobacter flavalbus]
MKSVTRYKIRINGEEFATSYKVKSIITLNEANRVPRAKLILLDGNVSRQDFELSSKEYFEPGAKIEIDLGYEGNADPVFKGIAVRHAIRIRESGESQLEIECKHAVVKLTTVRKSRYFRDASDKDAVSQILDDADIKYTIDEMEEIRHLQLVQYDSTSWDFILSRVEACGCMMLFDQEKLTISKPSMDGTDALTCQYGINVLAFDGLIDSETQFAAVESTSWSPSEQEIVVAEETAEFVNEIGNLSSGQLSGVLNPDPYALTGGDGTPLEELKAWTKAKATKSALSKATGTVRIRGNASIFPGKIIRLAGLGDRFNGRAFVTGIRHELSDGNWTSDIQFGWSDTKYGQQKEFSAAAAGGMLPAISGLHTGTVTALEGDPDGEFRIKVKLSASANDTEGIWARVAHVSAGSQYGFFFYPEIGNEVIVGFLNDDPRKAIVIGAMYSSANAPVLKVTDKNVQKGNFTKSNMSMIWDDEKKSVAISTPAGNSIEINEESGKLTITDKNKNRIEMNEKGISIESSGNLRISAKTGIEIEGVNISNKAKGKFVAEGDAGAEIRTKAIAVLKGSLVQIN